MRDFILNFAPYIIFTCLGFLSGSILFCKLIPLVVFGKDICSLSDDKNPGAANVFMSCGPVIGMICLILEICKGFVPVFISLRYTDVRNLLFAPIIAAPVIGHAVAPFNGFRGGKSIAVSFGVMLGMLPVTRCVLILAAIYIVTSTLIRVEPHRKRSIVTYALFAVGSAHLLIRRGLASVAVGVIILSLTVIYKHSLRFCTPEVIEKENCEKVAVNKDKPAQ